LKLFDDWPPLCIIPGSPTVEDSDDGGGERRGVRGVWVGLGDGGGDEERLCVAA